MIKLVLLLTKRCWSLRAIRFAWPPLMPVEIRRAFLRPDGGGLLVWSGGPLSDAQKHVPEVFWSRRGWNMLEDSEQRRSCLASMEAALSALVAGMFLCWPNLRRGAFTIPISSTFISWVYSHLGRPMEDSSLGKMLTDVEQLVQVHPQNSQGCQGFLRLRMSARLACGLPLPQEISWWPLEGVQFNGLLYKFGRQVPEDDSNHLHMYCVKSAFLSVNVAHVARRAMPSWSHLEVMRTMERGLRCYLFLSKKFSTCQAASDYRCN